MLEEKADKLKRLSRRETEVLGYFFRGSDFTVQEICDDFGRNEKTIRTYLTAIYRKLGVPVDINDNEKREWVVSEYAEAYKYVFKRGEWEAEQEIKRAAHPPKIFINPPDPIVIPIPERREPRPEPPPPPPARIPLDNFTGGIIAIVTIVIAVVLAILNSIWENQPQATDTPATQVRATGTPTVTVKPTVTAVVVTKTPRPTVSFTRTPREILPSPTYVIPNAGRILFEDQFNGDTLSSQWEPGDRMYHFPYYILSDGLLSLNSRDNQFLHYYSNDETKRNWVNYVINVKIIINKCVTNANEDYRNAFITAREDINGGGVRVFTWSSCDYPPGTELNVVAAVQGDRYTLILNGEEKAVNQPDDVLRDYPRGGIRIWLTAGSSIDYIVVRELP